MFPSVSIGSFMDKQRSIFGKAAFCSDSQAGAMLSWCFCSSNDLARFGTFEVEVVKSCNQNPLFF